MEELKGLTLFGRPLKAAAVVVEPHLYASDGLAYAYDGEDYLSLAYGLTDDFEMSGLKGVLFENRGRIERGYWAAPVVTRNAELGQGALGAFGAVLRRLGALGYSHYFHATDLPRARLYEIEPEFLTPDEEPSPTGFNETRDILAKTIGAPTKGEALRRRKHSPKARFPHNRIDQ